MQIAITANVSRMFDDLEIDIEIGSEFSLNDTQVDRLANDTRWTATAVDTIRSRLESIGAISEQATDLEAMRALASMVAHDVAIVAASDPDVDTIEAIPALFSGADWEAYDPDTVAIPRGKFFRRGSDVLWTLA